MSAVLTISVDDQSLLQKLEALRDKGVQLQPVLQGIGEKLLASTQHRFESKIAPDGSAWPSKITDAYAKRKAAGTATQFSEDASSSDPADLLRLTDQLADNLFSTATSDLLTIASPEKYAATHQFGRGNTAKRPFLGTSAEDLKAIYQVLEDHLNPI